MPITSPATLSIITSTLPEGRERNRGLALWGAMGALGASSGALLGGILTQAFGWQAIFAVNIPLGAIVVALGLLAIPSIAPVEGHPRHFDALGAALVTAGSSASPSASCAPTRWAGARPACWDRWPPEWRC